ENISKIPSSPLASEESEKDSDSSENDRSNESPEEKKRLDAQVAMRAKKLGEEVARLWSQFHKNLEDFKAKTNGIVNERTLPNKTSGHLDKECSKRRVKQSSSGVLAENITKENSPKSSLRGLSSDAKSDRSVPTVNSLAKPVENGVEKDKAMLDKRTPPTSPQTEGNQLFYQSMIDRIDKRP
ncbi:unnamed protein product, partial [Hymenolepis diminuta]